MRIFGSILKSNGVVTAMLCSALFIAGCNTDTKRSLKPSDTTKIADTGVAVSISGISPNSGPAAGGSWITIFGSGFVDDTIISMIGIGDIGETLCDNEIVLSESELVCQLGPHAEGLVDVTVTLPNLKSATKLVGFSYVQAPAPLTITPNAGSLAGGTQVTITGTGFKHPSMVLLGGTPCTSVTVQSATSLTCTPLPRGTAGFVDVTVFGPDLQQGSIPNAYHYRPAPTITGISPASGSTDGGTTISLYGTDFYTGMTVTIGGNPCTSVNVPNTSYLTCTSPASGSAGFVNVVATNTPDNQSITKINYFSYWYPMTVTSASPNSGPHEGGGGEVTFTGTNFGAWTASGGPNIYLSVPSQYAGDSWSQCTGFQLISSTQIKCTPSANAYPFGGLASLWIYDNRDNIWHEYSDLYTYVGGAVPITITDISPPVVSVNGGETITVTGTGFNSANAANWWTGGDFSVGFGPSANSPNWWCTATRIDDEHFTCTTPSVGQFNIIPYIMFYDLRINTWVNVSPGEISFTGGFDHQTLTSINPPAATYAGGTEVTLTGTGFGAHTTTAYFILNGNWIECTGVVVDSDTQARCTTGPGWLGGMVSDVYLLDNRAGWDVFSQDLFEYLGSAPHPTYLSAVNTSTNLNTVPSVGGVQIKVTGTEFGNYISQVSLKLDTNAMIDCGSINILSSTELLCTPATATPGYPGGTAKIAGYDTRYNQWDYSTSPLLNLTGTVEMMVINSISPTSGPMTGGTVITVTGSGLNHTNGTANLNGWVPFASPCTVVDSTTVTCITSPDYWNFEDTALPFTLTDGRDNSQVAGGTFTYYKCDLSATGFAGGAGTVGDPFQIDNAAQLQLVHDNLGCSFILTQDISLAGVSFTPLGLGSFFPGTFDGGGFTISDWTYAATVNYGSTIGFFTSLYAGSSVKNLGLVNAKLTGMNTTSFGILAGSNGATIESSYAIGTITNGNQNVGGLVGDNSGTITKSFFIGSVTGSQSIGGLVGYNNGPITKSFANATVTGQYYIGGVGGQNNNNISNSFALGNVIAYYMGGGLIGYGSGAVNTSYASTTVTATGGSYFGGFSGYNSGSGSLNFYNSQLSGYANSDGAGNNNATGDTTANMQADTIFLGASWDFASIWKMPAEGGTPILQDIPEIALLSATPGSKNFGIIDGSTNPKIFTVKNFGFKSATFISPSIGAAFEYDGAGTYPGTGNCGASLAPDASCTIGVKPTAATITAGSGSGNLSLSFDNGTETKTLQIALSAYTVVCDPNATPYGSGLGTSEIPYEICSKTQFAQMAEQSATFHLFSDLNFGGSGSPTDPINFYGTFDGGGKTISGLYNHSGQSFVGLFYQLNNATVSNLNITGADLIGNSYTGILAGYSTSSTISNVNVTGTVTGTSYSGGLIGFGSSVNIDNSTISADVTGSSNVGLLAGNSGSSTVSNISVTGSVTGTGSIGGLIGATSNTTINNCTTTGVNVTSTTYSGSIGGLVGNSTGLISNSQVVGGIVNVNGGYCAGGLVGAGSRSISYSSSSATINDGGVNVGGFIGCFWGGSGPEPSPVISFSNSTGPVNGAGASIGGFFGAMEGPTNATGAIIEDSYSTGNVTNTGPSYFYGGFGGGGNFWGAGCAIGTLRRVYSSGNVNAVGGYYYIGGLVGYSCATISDSYSTGIVDGATPAGGLIGQQGTSGANTGSVTNSYSMAPSVNSGTGYGSIGESTGITVGTGVYYWSGGTLTADPAWPGTQPVGLTTLQMTDQNNFVGYDFTNVWKMQGGVPVFIWQ